MSRPNPEESRAAEKKHFPYAFTPLKSVPRYARFRAEGRPPSACAWHPLRYCLKYRNKLRAAPEEEIAYFDRQRRLLRRLASEEVHEPDASLAMVGDLMWIRDGWSTFLSHEVLSYLNAHDAVLGNLETTVSPRFRVPRWLPDCIRFNSDPALITSFRRPDGRSTFAALSIANNHVLDYGEAGILDLMRFLEQQQILHCGVREREHDPPYVTFSVGGIKIGFHAATYGLNDPKKEASSPLRINTVEGLAPEDGSEVDVAGLRRAFDAMDGEGVDFKVVSLHWGFEYELYPSPKIMQAGREIVRAGADVILGSHPHVVQPAEVCFVNGYERRYGEGDERLAAMLHPTGCILDDPTGRPRKAIILYSLGNFTTAMYTLLCEVGLIRRLRLKREARTGRVDWFAPRGRLVCNLRRDPASGKRRLTFLKTHLQQIARDRPMSKRAQADLALLKHHVVADL